MKLHHKLADIFGYEIIKRRNLNDTLEQHLRNVLESCQINCVIDVGANTGCFASALRKNGYQGRIVSFEPVKSVFAQLAANSRDDDEWRVFQLAIGAEESSMPIFRMASSDFSSFHRPSAYGTERFPNRMKSIGEENVLVATLDSLCPEIMDGIEEPRLYLKLDTQGFDLEVLKGAQEVLEYVLGLQSEISVKPIYRKMPDHVSALAEFQRLGFDISGFYLVSRDKKTLAAIEYDCVLIRRNEDPHLRSELSEQSQK